MGLGTLFTTTTSAISPLDGSTGDSGNRRVSDFLTIQSLMNFTAMTGAITAAWKGLQLLSPLLSTIWVPYICAFMWAIISVLTSLDGLKKAGSDKVDGRSLAAAVFIGALNALVLASAVVGIA